MLKWNLQNKHLFSDKFYCIRAKSRLETSTYQIQINGDYHNFRRIDLHLEQLFYLINFVFISIFIRRKNFCFGKINCFFFSKKIRLTSNEINYALKFKNFIQIPDKTLNYND